MAVPGLPRAISRTPPLRYTFVGSPRPLAGCDLLAAAAAGCRGCCCGGGAVVAAGLVCCVCVFVFVVLPTGCAGCRRARGADTGAGDLVLSAPLDCAMPLCAVPSTCATLVPTPCTPPALPCVCVLAWALTPPAPSMPVVGSVVPTSPPDSMLGKLAMTEPGGRSRDATGRTTPAPPCPACNLPCCVCTGRPCELAGAPAPTPAARTALVGAVTAGGGGGGGMGGVPSNAARSWSLKPRSPDSSLPRLTRRDREGKVALALSRMDGWGATAAAPAAGASWAPASVAVAAPVATAACAAGCVACAAVLVLVLVFGSTAAPRSAWLTSHAAMSAWCCADVMSYVGIADWAAWGTG